MSAGLQIWTPSGVAQIDEQYRNLVLVDKQVVTTYSSNPRRVTPTATVSTNFAGQTVVALSGSGVAPWRSAASGSSFNVASRTNNTTVTVYFFALIAQQSLSGAGLEVCNGAGEVVFNSEYLPMRVSGVARIPDTDGAASVPGLAADRMYAGVIAHQRIHFEKDLDAYTTYVYEDMINAGQGACSANKMIARFLNYTTDPLPPRQDAGGLLLAIDVTHY